MKTAPRPKPSATNAPPDSLSEAGKARWREIMAYWDIDDEKGRWLLQTAFTCQDEVDAADAVLAKEGSVILDRFGQSVAPPLVRQRHMARSQLLAALRVLGLSDDTGERRPVGRPPKLVR